MKLKVRAMKMAAGRKLVLCDEKGELLPNQMRTEVRCGMINDIDTVTVTFAVGGDVEIEVRP